MINCPDPGCICHFANKQEWCNQRNAVMDRRDMKWIVDGSGDVRLVDDVNWSASHAKAEDDHKESERRKFNWRQDHPIRSE